MADKKDYTGILLEDIDSKFDLILEVVGAMQDNVKKIPQMSERFEIMESDLKMVKLSTTITNRDVDVIKIRTEKLVDVHDEVNNLKKRVKVLESSG